MPTCSICYERFTTPVSLPCGHVFCKECIRRTVDSIKSCSVQHFCPTCRTPYSVVTIDPSLVPPYLRPHIVPPIRQLFFDEHTPTASTSASAGVLSISSLVSPPEPSQAGSIPAPNLSTPAELGRLAADATALRMSCATWRRRAEVHAAANTGLLSFARAAKDHALRMRTERDQARSQCILLKRKLCELMPELASALADSLPPITAPPARAGLPVFLTQNKPVSAFYDNPADLSASHFGPPMKRRKGDADASEAGGGADAPPDVRVYAVSDARMSGGAAAAAAGSAPVSVLERAVAVPEPLSTAV
ncbi:hypothetical protein B0H15DRAFT_895948 [Mycena belliarum]|uniref:RING-type domain-containing protein n=1 Tax=Mycena belliarum TaxID=1033014 RepID=A0AAD6TN11_9AGAR|nr:hypothetical protein B0H15DRAFT_895948 [Mycena belliae]